MNLELGNPLDTRAVVAAQGPGMQITLIPFEVAFFMSSSPGSQILGIPASLTIATDFSEFNSSINREVLLCELFLLKLVSLFENSYFFKI